jgi:hypothetical protein
MKGGDKSERTPHIRRGREEQHGWTESDWNWTISTHRLRWDGGFQFSSP